MSRADKLSSGVFKSMSLADKLSSVGYLSVCHKRNELHERVMFNNSHAVTDTNIAYLSVFPL
jgi:hypothetical protein